MSNEFNQFQFCIKEKYKSTFHSPDLYRANHAICIFEYNVCDYLNKVRGESRVKRYTIIYYTINSDRTFFYSQYSYNCITILILMYIHYIRGSTKHDYTRFVWIIFRRKRRMEETKEKLCFAAHANTDPSTHNKLYYYCDLYNRESVFVLIGLDWLYHGRRIIISTIGKRKTKN